MKTFNSYFKMCAVAVAMFATAQTASAAASDGMVSFVNNTVVGDYTTAVEATGGKNTLQCAYSAGCWFAGGTGAALQNAICIPKAGVEYIKIKSYHLGARVEAKLECSTWGGSTAQVGVYIGCSNVDGSGGTCIGTFMCDNGATPGWGLSGMDEYFCNITAQATDQPIWIKRKNASDPDVFLYSFEVLGVPTEVDVTAPTAPTGVTAVASPTGTGATVSWTGLSTDAGGVVGYKIYNGLALVGETTSATQKSVMIFGLLANTTYNLSVKGYDGTGNYSTAAAAAAITTGAELLSLTSGMVGTASSEEISAAEPGKYSGSKTTDGLVTTNWQTQPGASPLTADLDINLATAQMVSRVEVDFKVPSPLGSVNYTILTSLDGVTYTPAVATPASPAKNTQNDFTAVSAQYIRIHCGGVDPLNGIGVFEIRAYGPAGAAGVASVADNSKMSIYPNPVVNNTFSFNCENFDTNNVKVSILDLLGKEVFTTKLDNASNTINAKGLKGLYIVRATNNNKSVSTKVVFE